MQKASAKPELLIKLKTNKKVREIAGQLGDFGIQAAQVKDHISGTWQTRVLDSPLRKFLAGTQVEIQSLHGGQRGASCLADCLKDASIETKKRVSGYVIAKFSNATAARRAAKQLGDDPLVHFAHQPATRQTMGRDTLRDRQWGLFATNTLAALNSPSTKQPADLQISVAVIDTGVAGIQLKTRVQEHPDLAGVVKHVNFGAGNDVFDADGHGTHVCGIIGAIANNDEGVTGVCRPASLLSLKGVLQPFSPSFREGAYHEALRFAVDRAINPDAEFKEKYGEIKVINLSLGGEDPDPTEKMLIQEAIRNNITVVCAMGNNDSDVPMFPAAIKGVIAVGAVNEGKQRWISPGVGGSNRGRHITLVAPGQDILSTVPWYPTVGKFSPSRYKSLSGTSMATAFVSGAAALLYARRPSATVEHIHRALTKSAQSLGRDQHSVEYGHGLLDIQAALRKIRSPFLMH